MSESMMPIYETAEAQTGRLKRHIASQDAEILRLRGALETIAQIQREKLEWADAETLFMVLDNKVEIARAALSSPAPQDDVIVPRELRERLVRCINAHPDTSLTEALKLIRAQTAGIEREAYALVGEMFVASLLGAPTRG